MWPILSLVMTVSTAMLSKNFSRPLVDPGDGSIAGVSILQVPLQSLPLSSCAVMKHEAMIKIQQKCIFVYMN